MKRIFYCVSVLLLTLVNFVVTANCLSLEDYESAFQHKSIIKKVIIEGKLNFSFFTKVDDSQECRTYFTINNNKFDSYPSSNDIDDICDNYTGKHEISLVKSVNYNKLTGLLGILVVNEYTASFASGGMHPYYGYHLYVYEENGDSFYKRSSLDRIGWGGGLLIGNQTQKTVKMECDGKEVFKLSKSQEILKYLAQKFIIDKTYLYKLPNKKTKMYLIKGDKVTILDEQTDDTGQKWYFINYKGKKDLNMWIKAEAVNMEAPQQVEPTTKPKKAEPAPQTKVETPKPAVAKTEPKPSTPKEAEATIAKEETTKTKSGSSSFPLLVSLLGLLAWRANT